MRRLFPKILRSMPGVEIEEVGFDQETRDHVHLMMQIPPKYAGSAVVARIKSQTASKLRKKYPWLEKVYWEENIVWSPGYFIASVGVNADIIKRYVRWQGERDSGQAKLNL